MTSRIIWVHMYIIRTTNETSVVSSQTFPVSPWTHVNKRRSRWKVSLGRTWLIPNPTTMRLLSPFYPYPPFTCKWSFFVKCLCQEDDIVGAFVFSKKQMHQLYTITNTIGIFLPFQNRFYFFLGIKTIAFPVLGKHCTTKPHPTFFPLLTNKTPIYPECLCG